MRQTGPVIELLQVVWSWDFISRVRKESIGGFWTVEQHSMTYAFERSL
jgi:hypothetical protein